MISLTLAFFLSLNPYVPEFLESSAGVFPQTPVFRLYFCPCSREPSIFLSTFIYFRIRQIICENKTKVWAFHSFTMRNYFFYIWFVAGAYKLMLEFPVIRVCITFSVMFTSCDKIPDSIDKWAWVTAWVLRSECQGWPQASSYFSVRPSSKRPQSI